MRLRIGLFAPAVLMLLIDAAPLPAAAAQPVNLASVDACSLLSQAEMTAAVGLPMSPGEHDAFPPNLPKSLNFCTWLQIVPPGPRPQPPVKLELKMMPFNAGYFELGKNMAGRDGVTSVSGLGDDAYYAETGILMLLNVRKGAVDVLVTWIPVMTDRQQVMDAERTIAAQVLSEL
jgi:hypothetical protein